MNWKNSRLRPLWAALSGALLWTAFPPLDWGWAAWLALTPLYFAVRGAAPRAAARLSYGAGAVYWVGTLYWLHPVTIPGWLLLALYSALYFIPFGMFLARATARPAGTIRNLGLMLGGALVWAGGEQLRSALFTGWPWNPLAVSQHANLGVLQGVAWGGPPFVSALIVWANLGFSTAWERWRGAAFRGGATRVHAEMAAVVLAVGAASFGGWAALRRLPPPDRAVRVALIQPAISQYRKWTPEFVDHIYGRLENLSRAALRAGAPDLLVWPETAVPEEVRTAERPYALVRALTTEHGVPLLLGSLDLELRDGGREHWFNSAALIGGDGLLTKVYDKQHRVLFGEYMPLEDRLPFMKSLSPVGMSISSGTNQTLFTLPGRDLTFAAPICFEDVIRPVMRAFARRGAQLFVNLTNDAWYDGTAGAAQHFNNSLPRAIETRRPLVRCANSGITGWIDARGAVRARLPNTGPDGRPAAGFQTLEITYRATPPVTLYARLGDVFGWGAALIGAGWLAALEHRARRVI